MVPGVRPTTRHVGLKNQTVLGKGEPKIKFSGNLAFWAEY